MYISSYPLGYPLSYKYFLTSGVGPIFDYIFLSGIFPLGDFVYLSSHYHVTSIRGHSRRYRSFGAGITIFPTILCFTLEHCQIFLSLWIWLALFCALASLPQEYSIQMMFPIRICLIVTLYHCVRQLVSDKRLVFSKNI